MMKRITVLCVRIPLLSVHVHTCRFALQTVAWNTSLKGEIGERSDTSELRERSRNVKIAISKGADDWEWGMTYSAKGGQRIGRFLRIARYARSRRIAHLERSNSYK